MDLERVKQNTSSLVSKQFYSGSTPADPGTVTVTVTRDDGTVLTTGGATTGSGAGPRSFTLTAATHNNLLDRLTVNWVSSSLGTLETVVEVVGDFLFASVELKTLVPAATDDQIITARNRVEQALEHSVGFAFVPRYNRATLNGNRTMPLRVSSYLRRVRWATTLASGVTTALTASDLLALSVNSAGFIAGYSWATGYGNVSVGYEHGMDSPPEPVRAAALDYARFLLTQDTSIDSRAERLVTDDGTLVFAGAGSTPVPSVNQVIDSYRIPAIA